MVGTAQYCLKKENIVLIIYFAPNPRFSQFSHFPRNLISLVWSYQGSLQFLSPNIATDDVEYRRGVWFCSPAREGLSHASFQVARISSLLSQVEKVKFVIVKQESKKLFLGRANDRNVVS